MFVGQWSKFWGHNGEPHTHFNSCQLVYQRVFGCYVLRMTCSMNGVSSVAVGLWRSVLMSTFAMRSSTCNRLSKHLANTMVILDGNRTLMFESFVKGFTAYRKVPDTLQGLWKKQKCFTLGPAFFRLLNRGSPWACRWELVNLGHRWAESDS